MENRYGKLTVLGFMNSCEVLSLIETNIHPKITYLLNSTLTALQTVISAPHTIRKPKISEKVFDFTFGIFIGVTGDIRGKLVITGDPTTFGMIGEKVLDMPIKKDTFISFCSEFANMIADSLSTNIVEDGYHINITSPTIMKGHTQLSGYKQGIKLPVIMGEIGSFDIHLLLD